MATELLPGTNTETEFCDLLKDIKRGKTKHFVAARRKHLTHFALGICAFILSSGAAVLTSVASEVADSESDRATAQTLKQATVLSMAMASTLVGLMTFLRLEKDVEGQRAIANDYLSLYRDGRAVLAKARDGRLDPDEFSAEWDRYRAIYTELNRKAEPFSTGERAVRVARQRDDNLQRSNGVGGRARLTKSERPGLSPPLAQ